MRKTYWWKTRDNMGDRLTAWMMYRLGEQPAWRTPAEADLVVVGSVLEHLPKDWNGTVCGAGLLRPESRVDLSVAVVLALRGKLTAERVTGLRHPPVLGDPGLLVSKFVSSSVAEYELGVIPHWSDTELATRFPYGHLIDVTDHPEKVVKEIAKCKRVISSSLHGIVVADAFGIPRQAEIFAQAAREGGDFKFRDYASLYDGNPHFGEMWRAPHHIVERIQEELWEALMIALGLEITRPTPPPHRPKPKPSPCPQISMLVPFRDNGEHRDRVWKWLERYWANHLDSVEIVEGHDGGHPFSKAAAINDAASRARGRVFVIADADAYMRPDIVQWCADGIDLATRHGRRLWFMPYSRLYRLNEATTLELLETSPRKPYAASSPPDPSWLDGTALYGPEFGAMMQILPREAFFLAGGWDGRFRGWGGEDCSAMFVVDTLYAQHEIVNADMLHFWHEKTGHDWRTRRWAGQFGRANARLTQRYAMANGEPGWMQALVDEHIHPVNNPCRAKKRRCFLRRRK